MSVNISEIFGENVFSMSVMRERLPKAVPVEETQQEATGREKLRRAEKTPA